MDLVQKMLRFNQRLNFEKNHHYRRFNNSRTHCWRLPVFKNKEEQRF